MSGNLICWDRKAVAFATQIDVGGLEIGDEYADAVFAAIHHPLPLVRVRDVDQDQRTPSAESDFLAEFAKPIDSNEPRLLFVTGDKGTGKSHLVRWLKSKIGPRPAWHVVYIEKRNTNLRRVIERILDGINTPKAVQLREALATAGSEINSDEEAMSALLNRLDHLVQFDQATTLRGLSQAQSAEIDYLRARTHRLLGDYTFRKELSRSDGPVHRLVRLALTGADAGGTEEADLHLTERDLVVEPSKFEDMGQEIQKLVNRVNSHKQLRSDIAALCDSYLERAKAEVFTGPSTDLLEVFEDVRKEIKARGQELCLFVEDLVLLHGIDKQLAQALTVPANGELCRLRAAIAVTDGYLGSVSTFADRGIHFEVDVNPTTIGTDGLRDFVGRYLNVGRLSSNDLSVDGSDHSRADQTTNACHICPVRDKCHATFGRSSLGHGLYPFNSAAVDRLVRLANQDSFRPRFILRQAIRGPLEIAENELGDSSKFPSREFAKDLDPTRREIPVEIRSAITRLNTMSADAEMSLRAFYAKSPPEVDQALLPVADYLGVTMTALNDLTPPRSGPASPVTTTRARTQAAPAPVAIDEFQAWTENTQLKSPTAHKIRTWICEKILDTFREGPYGLPVTEEGRQSWRIGNYDMRLTDISIKKSGGDGGIEPKNPFRIEVSDDNALMLRGIVAILDGHPIDKVDSGRWYFALQERISGYVNKIARLADTENNQELRDATTVLTVLRNVAPDPGTTVRNALPAMLNPDALPSPTNDAIRTFAKESRATHRQALIVLRNRATAAKGAGMPSVIDAGLIYADVAKHLKAGKFPDSTGGPEAKLGRNLQERLDRASRRAWADVAQVITELETRLLPDEDLDSTRAFVGQLVDLGHVPGKLPHPESKTQHDSAANRLQSGTMETYRKLARKVADGATAADLWHLRDDPLPILRDLNEYIKIVDKMLGDMETKFSDRNEASVAIETENLIGQFRGLADALDVISRQEDRG